MIQSSTLVRGLLLVVACLLVLATAGDDVMAQRIINIPPGFGTINNVIRGDTLSNGTRVDTNTVYRLARGGYYILNGTFDHSYPVNIEGTPGPGAKPIIVQGVPSGGTAPAEAWSPRATLKMKNIYISAMDELGGNHERIVRIRGNGIRIVIDSCVLNIASQAGFRFDGTNVRMYFFNSVISNIGTGASPDNGRGFDDRGVDIDTLVLENSTFYNLTSRVIRDQGGITKYCKTNHCTLYNIGQFGTSYGICNTAIFTNNLVVNGGYYGNPPSGTRQLIQLLPLTAGGVQVTQINNNNFYLDSAVIKIYPDTVKQLPTFDSMWTAAIAAQGSGATVYGEKITFTRAPAPPANVVADWYANPAPPNPDLDTAGVFDFKYPTGQLAYTRGSDGKPLGDVRWFGIPLTGVEEIGTALPAAFQLYDNYPNPFNPETIIRFDVRQKGDVRLEVFTALGQKVATLANGNFEAGSYQVRWDGSRADGLRAASGVYLYRLNVAGFVATKKMLLLK